jgi:hypothetical protein
VPATTDDGVLRVAAFDDLMGHKLKLILQRAEGRDYQDIVAMLATGARLERGLAAATALFGAGFPVMECLKALGYYADLNEAWRLDGHAPSVLLDAVRALPSSWPAMPIVSRALADRA